MDHKTKKVVFVLTYLEQKEWNKFYPAWMFNQVYTDYQFIILDNGNQSIMKEWCNLTGSYYYSSEYNIGSSGGYNWIFKSAELLGLKRAALLQADVEIINKECLDKLFDDKWQENDIPFWPQEPRANWDQNPDNEGGTYNLGQFFSFNPTYLLENNLLVDENYVVTHFDDADLMRRMLEAGTKPHNLLLDFPSLDCMPDKDNLANSVPGLYNMHHFSSKQSGSDNHKEWEVLNQPYHNKKWFKNSDHAWETPFGHCEPESKPTITDYKRLDYNKKEPHSHKWLPLGYPPYPVEHELNRFWEELTKNST
jgi:hypothetical protein